MKTVKLSIFLAGMFIVFSCGKNPAEAYGWKIMYDSETKGVRIERKSKMVCERLYASYVLDGKEISTKEYADVRVKEKNVKDESGTGRAVVFTYRNPGLPALVQSFYVYPDKDYLLTEFTLESKERISSNYMAPVNTDHLDIIRESAENRALFIPFDNDCWIRYQSHPLNFDVLTSYEVTAVFNNDSRNGFVTGSVEHDNWKSAVKMTGNKSNALGSLVCYGGAADSLTRDSKSHGALSGKKIKSPKVFLT
jgi:alpha-galactosidase